MSAFITTIFVLKGFYAGKTINLGGYQFTDGELELTASPEDTGLVARALERNWQAYPKGHPELDQEQDNGQRDLSQGSPSAHGNADVSGAVQSAGEGTAAGDADASQGTGNGEAASGQAAELANGDGQQASVTDANKDPIAEVNAKLLKAVHELDPKDDKHWTGAGLPAMTAVEAFYGSADITRADVEAAAPGYTRAVAAAK